MQAAYKAYQGQEVTGLLCLLYVAMTRARHSLHLFLDAPGAGITPARIILETLGVAIPNPPRHGWHRIWVFGDENWYAGAEGLEPSDDGKTTGRPAVRFAASVGRRSRPIGTSERAFTPRMATDLLKPFLT